MRKPRKKNSQASPDTAKARVEGMSSQGWLRAWTSRG
jgi:hypothetical protein